MGEHRCGSRGEVSASCGVVEDNSSDRRIGMLSQPHGPVAAHGETDDRRRCVPGVIECAQLANTTTKLPVHGFSTLRSQLSGVSFRGGDGSVVKVDATNEESSRREPVGVGDE